MLRGSSSRALPALGAVLLLAGASHPLLLAKRDASVASMILAADRVESGAREAPTLGIVFHPRDCGGDIEALAYWNRLHRTRRVRVVGLVRDAAGDERLVRKIRAGAGLEFPVRAAADGALARRLGPLGYGRASVVLVLDAAGRTRMIVPLDELSTPAARENVARFASALRPD